MLTVPSNINVGVHGNEPRKNEYYNKDRYNIKREFQLPKTVFMSFEFVFIIIIYTI